MLSSLTIFFPFYNDAGTVEQSIDAAYKWGSKVAKKLEVIAIHGGPSTDDTWNRIVTAKKKHQTLRVLDKRNNTEGYAVIKHGFYAARNDWVFYTDGDMQYHLDELKALVAAQAATSADVVNGYKISRKDPGLRVVLGEAYRLLGQSMFKPQVRDITCDFRLIKRNLLKRITFTATGAAILIELLKGLERHGAIFTEIPVHHYPRMYGTSTYSFSRLIRERVIGDFKLYIAMKKSL